MKNLILVYCLCEGIQNDQTLKNVTLFCEYTHGDSFNLAFETTNVCVAL